MSSTTPARITGLDDFGRHGLHRAARRSCSTRSRPTTTCGRRTRLSSSSTVLKAAANRLRIQHYWSEHPGPRRRRSTGPINVVALPRSGSTHLENLLAADRRLRHLPVYLAAQPAPQPGEEPGPDGVDPRWTRAAARWEHDEPEPDHGRDARALARPRVRRERAADPRLRQLPVGMDGVRARLPRPLLAHDQTPHYRYMRDVLKLVAHQFPATSGGCSSRTSTASSSARCSTAYPDATVVMIHRDPVATLQSLLTMRGLAFKASRKVPDIDAHVAYWVDRIEQMLRALHARPPRRTRRATGRGDVRRHRRRRRRHARQGCSSAQACRSPTSASPTSTPTWLAPAGQGRPRRLRPRRRLRHQTPTSCANASRSTPTSSASLRGRKDTKRSRATSEAADSETH